MDGMGLGKGGRNALVTGAARRIGGAIALRLAADGFGIALHTSAAVGRQRRRGCARTRSAMPADAPVVIADLGSPAEIGAAHRAGERGARAAARAGQQRLALRARRAGGVSIRLSSTG